MNKTAAYQLEAEPLLLQRAAAGDRSAYAVLYQFYLPKLYHYLYGIIRSKEDTEEILQDIFLKLWENKEDLTEIKTLNSYLFKIARNRLMNLYDHQKVRRKAMDYIGRDGEAIGNNSEDSLIYSQYGEIVERALSQLPPKRRQVFEMSLRQEMSHDQIAEAMQISKSMVKKQLTAANRHVKEYLHIHAGISATITIAAGLIIFQ
ncbi:RNA polymerase sigma factor [Mucilaginibacter sp.]|jgi:RNA polymerase sigma-70 factor (ECF subfamily)|uniref:RNA polymerase sigma factor n=1 Tax=Mucilaginibacter sp. TaxID=1882438 RepID=UPI00356914C1